MEHNIPAKPVGTKIIVFPLPHKEEEHGGIIVPISANAELSEGEIVEVSEAIKDLYKIGDIVLYHSRKGATQYFNGTQYLWLNVEPHLEEVWGIKK